MNKKQKGFFAAAALWSGALGGCAVMNTHAPVPGWPELKIVEHHVPHFRDPEILHLPDARHGELLRRPEAIERVAAFLRGQR